MARVPLIKTALIVASLLASAASAQTPKLTINGVTSVNNSATPHLRALGSLDILINGTPNLPFALLLSAEAYDGVPGGEPNQTTGFFLKRWQPQAGVDSPIHPVFDGIGTSLIASKLPQSPSNPSWTAGDFLADTPSSFFKLDATGKFQVTGVVPSAAYLVNNSSPGNPVLIPLESAVIPSNVFLFLQVVEYDPGSGQLHVGNGMKVFFDKLTFPATIAYSEGQDANQTTTIVAQKQQASVIVDTDLNAAPLGTNTISSDFSAFGSNIDFWMIALAGVQQVIPTSMVPNGANGTGANPPDPDLNASIMAVWNFGSSPEFLNPSALTRNNENREFPMIRLPGGRYLFHWRESSVASPTYGFGIYFESTGTFRNLVPAAFGAFTETTVLSPWEVEVGITPDGSRAIVVLDQNSVSTANDRVFLLNLDPGGNFSNGFPIIERTPSPTTDVRRVYEESISFTNNGAGGWVGFFLASNNASATQATYPNKLFRVNMDGASTPSTVIPATGDSAAVLRIDRQPMISPDRNTLCVIGGSTTTNENVFAVKSITTSTHVVQNISKLVSRQLAEWTDVYDGQTGVGVYSADSQVFAFARATPTQFIPNVARIDGTTTSSDLIADISAGGQFAIAGDFPAGRDYCFTSDAKWLIFSQGSLQTGFAADRMDVFAVDLVTKHAVNLTRTMLTATYDGPWDPIVSTTPPIDQRASIDCGGQFVSNDGDTLFYFRDARFAGVLPLFDRFDLIAFDLTSVPGNAPEFLITNIFGNEFAPGPGQAPPTGGAPFVTANGFGSLSENSADYTQIRRIGGTGPLKDYYYMVARLANLVAGDPRTDTDQLFLFDGANPSPAIQLTNYGTNSSPIAVAFSSRIRNIIPSQTQNRVAFILDHGGGATTTAGVSQDLLVLDLDNFGAQVRVPSSASPFSRYICAGSTHWVPTSPEGLVFAAGTIPRAAGGIVDGQSDSGLDLANPIDSTAFFYRFATPISPETVTPIAAAPSGSNRRLVHVFAVKTP